MDSSWILPLDALAAGGVIDFDAPAFLLDQNPRYVGHPDMERLPMTISPLLPEGIKLKDVPQFDTLEKSQDNNLVSNPTWKKVLFGLLIAGGAIFGGYKILKAKGTKIPEFKMPKIDFSRFKRKP